MILTNQSWIDHSQRMTPLPRIPFKVLQILPAKTIQQQLWSKNISGRPKEPEWHHSIHVVPKPLAGYIPKIQTPILITKRNHPKRKHERKNLQQLGKCLHTETKKWRPTPPLIDSFFGKKSELNVILSLKKNTTQLPNILPHLCPKPETAQTAPTTQTAHRSNRYRAPRTPWLFSCPQSLLRGVGARRAGHRLGFCFGCWVFGCPKSSKQMEPKRGGPYNTKIHKPQRKLTPNS